ncbi:hypothetical protein EVAR_81838_1 [Eumeta japonica]|uniref:NWD2 C-terminal beta-propeller domain-containing protein n=1 Tax=Eumeta variegata TaxID=151549 RepID=A0A4C1XQN9_EUMVA|nr:hypothetical protein EVAR_81838_1 [Eumeta japonica]
MGICAPTRGGLDLIEVKRGTSVQQLISRAAEGVFSIICMFSSDDSYVFYYHSGRKTLRVFRTLDGKAIAEYRAPAEVTAVASAHGGAAVALASQDGCLTVLNIVDPNTHRLFVKIVSVIGDPLLEIGIPSRFPQHRISAHLRPPVTPDQVVSPPSEEHSCAATFTSWSPLENPPPSSSAVIGSTTDVTCLLPLRLTNSLSCIGHSDFSANFLVSYFNF